MNADLQEAIARARSTLGKHNTFVLGEDWYGVRRLLDVADWTKRKRGLSSYDVFGEDDCGNEFLLAHNGEIYFWDHETAGLRRLADSLPAFLSGLIPQPRVELQPGQVKKAWIDPAFLEEQKRLGSSEG